VASRNYFCREGRGGRPSLILEVDPPEHHPCARKVLMQVSVAGPGLQQLRATFRKPRLDVFVDEALEKGTLDGHSRSRPTLSADSVS